MTRFHTYAALLLLVLLSTPTFAQSGEDFTIAALPDTQFYSRSFPQIFAAETRWIAEHAAEKNIKLVIGLGDIVDGGGSIAQWQNANAAIRNVDGKVPTMLAIGNHDYDRNNPPGRTASAHNFNAYFGPEWYRDKSWYKGNFPSGSNENFYGTFTFSGKPYLVVVLEVFPRDIALTWAESVIKAHPGSDVIVVTHAYTYSDNTRMDRCDANSAASFGAGADNDGQQIWDKLVRKYSNIVLVLSGHVVQGDGTGRRTDLGDGGNLVNQILSDYQSWPNGGNGYIRLVTISPSKNQISVKTYSPYLDSYLTDSHNQFAVPYKNAGLQRGVASISGVVKNATDCSALSSVSLLSKAGDDVTDMAGRFNISAAGPATYTLSINRSGYGTIDNQVKTSALPGLPSPVKVLVAPKGTLRGTVTRGGSALPSVKIVIAGGTLRLSAVVTSQSDGTFNAGWVPVGNYRLTASSGGQSVTVKATVTTGRAASVAVDLPQ